jgi:hypothetical protein
MQPTTRRGKGGGRRVNRPIPKKAVTHKEINGFGLPSRFPIPGHVSRPTQQRTVRMFFTAIPPIPITPNLIALEDAAEYLGTTAIRFNNMRIISARVWGPDTLDTVYATSVSFFTQGSALPIHVAEDSGTSGAERANVGYVFPYANRSFTYATSDTTSIILSVTTIPVAATANSFVVDVTVLFD